MTGDGGAGWLLFCLAAKLPSLPSLLPTFSLLHVSRNWKWQEDGNCFWQMFGAWFVPKGAQQLPLFSCQTSVKPSPVEHAGGGEEIDGAALVWTLSPAARGYSPPAVWQKVRAEDAHWRRLGWLACSGSRLAGCCADFCAKKFLPAPQLPLFHLSPSQEAFMQVASIDGLSAYT